MASGRRLGIIVPSSNTVVEPLAAEALAGADVTAHVARIRVHDVALDATSRAQFDLERYADAVDQLADADVDAIVWAGTSASWLGADHDRALCEAAVERTGIPATTCVLAMHDRMRSFGTCRFGLVTPYTADVHGRIVANEEASGHICVGSANLGGSSSVDFADVAAGEIEAMVREAAASGPDIVLIMCTNLRGATVAAELTDELGLPVIDSAAATIEAGVDLLRRASRA